MMQLRQLAAMLLLTTLPTYGLSAEGEDHQPKTGAVELDTLTVTATRRERPLREVANSITVVDAERINETLVADIKDLARYTPWLSVGNDPSRFGLSGFNIRGIGGNRVVTEIDGVPVANGFSVGSYSNSGRDAINPAMVKRVEILRGPASALYGSDAMGGVISYTTFEPDDFLLDGKKDHHFGTLTGYDARDNSLVASLSYAADLGDLSMLISATGRTGHETENRAATKAGKPNPRSYDQTDFGAKLVKATRRGTISLTLDGRRTHATTNVDDLEGQGRFASTVALQGDDRLARTRLSLGGNMQLDSRFADDLDWAVYSQESSSDQRSIEERVGSRRSPSPTLRFPEFRFNERVVGTSINAARDWNGDGQAHRLLYGLQLDQRTVDESRDNQLINLDTGESTKIVLGETFPVRDFPVSRITEAAVFIHDEIRFGGGQFTLIPGLRAEYYDLKPRTDAVYTEDNPTTSPVAIRELSVAPKLGAVLQLGESASLFAQYARGFRSPPFEDANIGLEIPLFNIRAIPNPDLKPETSDGFEAGLRLMLADLRFTFSAFHNRYKNFIDTKVNLGPDPETGVLIFQSLNRDRAIIQGFEAEFEYDLDPGFEGLTLAGNLASTRGDDSARDLPLNNIDPRRATLAMRYNHPGQRWGTELVASFAAAKTRVDESSLALFQPPGYAVFDLLAYYQLSKSSRIDFAFFNLGNRRYWDWADVRGRPADDPLIEFYSRPGINFAANLRINW